MSGHARQAADIGETDIHDPKATDERIPVTDTANDEDLLRRSGQADRAAFGMFMNQHAGSVYRLLISLGAEPDDAEDALQECFVSAWRSAATFRGRGSARAWLYTIARNALRRRHRLRAGEPSELEALEVLGTRAGWGAPTDFGTRLELKEHLDWALGQLPVAEREAVTLRDLEGLSGREAAEAMGVSVAAMKSRLHRGRLLLLNVLREMEADHA